MKLMRQTASGRWVECGDQTDEYLVDCAEHKNITIDELKIKLSNCEKISCGTDWYENLADAESFEAREAKREKQEPEMVKCSCGHTVPKHLVMSASMGTSCERCYDRMSD